MLSNEEIRVKVSAPHGLFTREEFVSERVSYDVIPPSAAVGLLNSIFAKHEMLWVIQEIQVLSPILFLNLTHNEVDRTQRTKKGQAYPPVDVQLPENRTLRTSRVLVKPKYVLVAKALVHPYALSHGHHPSEYIEQFYRRLQRGRSWNDVYMGKREFAVQFEEVEGDETPISVTRDLGTMRLHINYETQEAVRFRAQLENGVMQIPQDFLLHVLSQQLKDTDPNPARFERRQQRRKEMA